MTSLTKGQLAILHVAKKQLGLDDATYRGMLKSYDGVKSAKDLSLRGFSRIMDCFADAGFGTKLPERSGMATPGQIRKIYASWWALSGLYYDEGQERTSLKGFLKKRFAVDNEKFLTFGKASSVIEAIKRINERQVEERARCSLLVTRCSLKNEEKAQTLFASQRVTSNEQRATSNKENDFRC